MNTDTTAPFGAPQVDGARPSERPSVANPAMGEYECSADVVVRKPITRYRALREMGCGPVTSFFIHFLNEVAGVPRDQIRFMTVIIDIEDEPNPGVEQKANISGTQ